MWDWNRLFQQRVCSVWIDGWQGRKMHSWLNANLMTATCAYFQTEWHCIIISFIETLHYCRQVQQHFYMYTQSLFILPWTPQKRISQSVQLLLHVPILIQLAISKSLPFFRELFHCTDDGNWMLPTGLKLWRTLASVKEADPSLYRKCHHHKSMYEKMDRSIHVISIAIASSRKSLCSVQSCSRLAHVIPLESAVLVHVTGHLNLAELLCMDRAT